MSIFIERFLLAILAALAVLLAVTNPMEFSVPSRIIGVIIIFILAGIVAYFSETIQRRRQREQSQHNQREVKAMSIVSPAIPAPLDAQPEAKVIHEEERIFVGESITHVYLLGFFERLTAVQATNATR